MTRRPQSTCALYTSAHYNRDNTVINYIITLIVPEHINYKLKRYGASAAA